MHQFRQECADSTCPRVYHQILKLRLVFLHLIDHSENIRYFIVVLGTFQYVQSKYYKKQVLLPASVFDKQNGRLHRANTFVHKRKNHILNYRIYK